MVFFYEKVIMIKLKIIISEKIKFFLKNFFYNI